MEKMLFILLAIVYCTIVKTAENSDKCELVPVADSLNYFFVEDEKRGNCTNNKPIRRHLHECVGYCPSSSIYNSTRNQLVPGCMLCAPERSELEDIELDCEDGSKLKTRYLYPLTCSCKECLYVTPVPGADIVVPPPKK